MERPREARSVRCCSTYRSCPSRLRKYGRKKLPNDYQYDNARPGEELKQTGAGLTTELDANFQKGSRASYANWLTSEATHDLPQLSLTVLERVFGLALVEPLDNVFDDTYPPGTPIALGKSNSSPELRSQGVSSHSL